MNDDRSSPFGLPLDILPLPQTGIAGEDFARMRLAKMITLRGAVSVDYDPVAQEFVIHTPVRVRAPRRVDDMNSGLEQRGVVVPDDDAHRLAFRAEPLTRGKA
ncbi:hypothetical protein D9M68_561350 [compost metagenome]